MNHEYWLPITGYEELYEVSDAGRVRSLGRLSWGRNDSLRPVTGRLLKPGAHSGGYSTVTLYDAERLKRQFYVHRLVAQHFVSNLDALPHINHKNLDKGDNRAVNLEWVTPGQNMRHAADNGRCHGRTNVNFQRKLIPAQVDEILTRSGSSAEVADEYGVSSALILKIRKGRVWLDPYKAES